MVSLFEMRCQTDYFKLVLTLPPSNKLKVPASNPKNHIMQQNPLLSLDIESGLGCSEGLACGIPCCISYFVIDNLDYENMEFYIIVCVIVIISHKS